MTNSLRVLIIDDAEDDTRLITNELQRGGFDLLFERVNSPEAIKAALDQKTWDVVISNFVVSQCTALEALVLLQEKNLDLPFIIVSDTMSEDIALQCLKAGIHVFFKKKNIKLLVPAVERGLREVAIKHARQQAEEALISSNQELNDIIEFLPDATFVVDNEKKVIAWNRAIEEMTGIKKHDMIGQGDNAVTIPFYGEKRPHLLDLIDVSDKELESKYRYVQRKGNTLYAETFTPALYGGKGAYVWATGAPLFDAQGNRVGAIESIRDITEYKQAEQTLRASEEKFRQLFENMSNCVAIYEATADGEDFIFKDFNRAAEQVEGVTKETIVGKSVLKVFPGVKKFGLFEVFKRVWKTGNPEFYPTKLYKDNRISGWKENCIYKLSSGEVVAIYEDVTTRKQAEEALRQSQLQQKALLDNIPDAAWLKDSESRFVAVNEAFARAVGYNAEDLVGKTDFEIWPKEVAETNRSEDQEVILTKQRQVIEQSFVSHREKVAWVEKIKTPIINENNEVIGTVGISRDITQRKQTEQALRENEKKYQSLYQEFLALFDAVPENMHLISPDLKLIWINQTSAASLNKNRSDLIGQYCYQARHNRSEPCEICPARRCFRSKTIEFDEVTTPDGLIWDLRAAPIIDDQGEIKSVVELAHNITEKKKAFQEMLSLQEQLRQSQKMEAIGRLAGGVAHDFNNLLTVIQVNSELALYELANNDSLKLKLGDIKKATERAANLTRQLLAFSRRQVLNLKVINLNFILEDLEKMLHRIIGEEIELITSFADDLGRVKADPGEIEQVIINLAVNAKDAMPHGGTLTIATSNVDLDEQYVRRHLGTLPGSYVVISVTDTGVGIPKEIHEQIFDPFFTTKENGKGTGLGLATVYGIVKQSGGHVHLYSEPGKGTTLKVYLPRVDEPLEEAGKKKEADVSPRGNETILIVEDDSSVRKIAVQVLTNQGYNVLVSESGGDALLICEQEKNPIHLVLTDVVMPKMSGPELIERLKKVRKDFSVLYMSGYTDKHILKGLDDELNFIQKPFTIDVLAKKVRDALDTKKGSKRK